MIADLRKLTAHRPFVPFTIHTGDGDAIGVSTVDHIAVPPSGDRMFVFFDQGRYDTIRPLMISRLTVDQQTADA